MGRPYETLHLPNVFASKKSSCMFCPFGASSTNIVLPAGVGPCEGQLLLPLPLCPSANKATGYGPCAAHSLEGSQRTQLWSQHAALSGSIFPFATRATTSNFNNCAKPTPLVPALIPQLFSDISSLQTEKPFRTLTRKAGASCPPAHVYCDCHGVCLLVLRLKPTGPPMLTLAMVGT